MSIPFFLYRRLCRWITCELKLSDCSKLALQSKYEVASFKDVFCHPFYWQVFQWINTPPKLVIDCGAHCGHFSILADLCFHSKFGSSNAEYILVEPNPFLLSVINKNLSDTSLAKRSKLIQGFLGSNSDSSTLWIHPKNYLVSSLQQTDGAKPYSVNHINLSTIIDKRNIDLLKLDIEGGEFDFIESNLSLFHQVNLLFMELHNAPKNLHQKLLNSLNNVGLKSMIKPLKSNGQQLMIFQRSNYLLT
jgi:FkbM family methyltransferase